MADEKKEGKKEDNLSQGLSRGILWAIIGGVAGIILSIFAVVDAGFAGVPAMMVLGLGGAAFGFCLGFIYGVFPKKYKVFGAIIIIIVLFLIVYWLFVSAKFGGGPLGFVSGYLSPLSLRVSDASNAIGNFFFGFKQYGYCLSNDKRCPFLASLETSEVENKEDLFNIRVVFSNRNVIGSELNLFASIYARNPNEEPLTIIPKCYVGSDKSQEIDVVRLGAYSEGNLFNFPTSETEMSTSLRCSGTVDGTRITDTAILTLERPAVVKVTWPITVKDEEETRAPVKSSMDYNAPYSVSLTSPNRVAFGLGKEYDFEIIIKKQTQNVKFKKLDSLVITSTQEIMIDCPTMSNNELHDIDFEQLKQIANYDSTVEEFTFLCSLYVSEATSTETVVPVIADVKYTVESDYKTTITKQI